jgi:protein-tyrosine phosphatase
VTCALILASLGVSREDIVEDFMLTGKHYDALASLDRNIPQVVGATNAGEWPREALLPIFGVEPAYIDTALDQVEAEGGVEAFLQGKLGVSADVVERLRAQLLA